MFSVHIIIIYRYILEYYTDQHNVDEDRVTISCIGEHWCGAAFAGLHCRHIDWPVYWYTNDVASKNNIQPPILLGGYVMYYFTISLD